MEKKPFKRLMHDMRIFAFSFAGGMAILTVLLYFKKYSYNYLLIPGGLSLYHLGSALLFPFLAAPFYYLSKLILKVIGLILIFLVFTVVFYGIVTPVSLLIRLFGLDHIKKSAFGWVMHRPENPERVERLY